MVSSRPGWIAVFTILFAAATGGSLRAAVASPEEVLKSHELKRVGTAYVLPAESEVQKKMTVLKGLSGQLTQALRRQRYLEQQVDEQRAMLRELNQRRVLLSDTLSGLDQQLNVMSGPARVNPLIATQRSEVNNQRNQVVTNLNQIIGRIQIVQTSDASDPKVRKQIESEASQKREQFIQAVLELRQEVDAAAKAYDVLSQNDEVKTALEALGRNSKSKPKLGPSSQFLANVKLLERVEKSVITDSAVLHREGEVLWVDVTFNGKFTKRMVFDTGASVTTIPASFAAELGLTPSASDPPVVLETADGTKVNATRTTIPSMRLGRFPIENVPCVVMPANKGNVAPLLGQSFLRNFTYKITSDGTHVFLSRVELPDQQGASKSARPSKGSAKGKRTTKSKGTPGRDATGN